MDTKPRELTTRELRTQLSDVLGRAMYGNERVGITRHGKLAAYVISVDDYETLEALEMANDIAAYDEAVANDDGERVSLEDLIHDLKS